MKQLQLTKTDQSRFLERVYSVDDKFAGIQMSYCQHDLFGLGMSKVRFSILEIKFIFKSLLFQLNKMHKAGFVHRDIKSANILLNNKGNVYLSDFGQALASKNASNDFKCGSPIYRSPEIFLGLLKNQKGLSSDSIDPFKADIWSLGCVIVELIIGSPLFLGCRNFLDLLFKYFCLFNSHSNFNKFKIFLNSDKFDSFKNNKKFPLKDLLLSKNKQIDSSFLDLILQMLNPEPSLRPSCETLINHFSLIESQNVSLKEKFEVFETENKEFRELEIKKKI